MVQSREGFESGIWRAPGAGKFVARTAFRPALTR
jgi:hypothetical protein